MKVVEGWMNWQLNEWWWIKRLGGELALAAELVIVCPTAIYISSFEHKRLHQYACSWFPCFAWPGFHRIICEFLFLPYDCYDMQTCKACAPSIVLMSKLSMFSTCQIYFCEKPMLVIVVKSHCETGINRIFFIPSAKHITNLDHLDQLIP